MAKLLTLTVTGLHRTTSEATAVTLEPDGAVPAFQPGQYLTFQKEFDGRPLRRSYSLTTAPGGPLQVAVKQVEGGRFSTWVNTELTVGDRLEALPPMGRFHAEARPGAHVLMIAAGSGITPILSILRHRLTSDPAARVTLIYANSALPSVMFRETLEDLKNRHMTRLALLYVFSRGGGEGPLLAGRLDGGKFDTLLTKLIPAATIDQAFICGPPGLRDLAEDRLAGHGLNPGRIRSERFANAAPRRAASAARSAAPGTRATLLLDGATHRIAIAPGQTLLDAALAAGLDAPHACKAGVCASCRCRVTAGEADMVANHALEDHEIADGLVLSCQSFARTAEISYVYDDG